MLYIVHAFLKETLRIFPSALLVARTSHDDPLIIPNTNAGNLYLPPKTQIMMSSLLAHKRTLWGPNAEAFRPERWFEPALLEKVARTPFMYSLFYGGPRVVSHPFFLVFPLLFLIVRNQCLGQEFALSQAGFFIVRLLQHLQSFALAPDFMPAGALPPAYWVGMPGCQGVEIQPGYQIYAA